MKRAPLILLVALAASAALAQMHHEALPASGLVPFKALIGSWKGTDPQGKPLTISYKMVSEDNDHTFSFVFQDATNLKSKNDAHINCLTITIKDKDHIFQEWSMIEKGKETREIFTFERVN